MFEGPNDMEVNQEEEVSRDEDAEFVVKDKDHEFMSLEDLRRLSERKGFEEESDE